VAGYSVRRIQELFPAGWSEAIACVGAPSALLALWEYLRRNRGVRLEHLRMIRACTLRKMVRGGAASRGGSQS
jgi:ubiquinone biosynthesis protein COQ9